MNKLISWKECYNDIVSRTTGAAPASGKVPLTLLTQYSWPYQLKNPLQLRWHDPSSNCFGPNSYKNLALAVHATCSFFQVEYGFSVIVGLVFLTLVKYGSTPGKIRGPPNYKGKPSCKGDLDKQMSPIGACPIRHGTAHDSEPLKSVRTVVVVGFHSCQL